MAFTEKCSVAQIQNMNQTNNAKLFSIKKRHNSSGNSQLQSREVIEASRSDVPGFGEIIFKLVSQHFRTIFLELLSVNRLKHRVEFVMSLCLISHQFLMWQLFMKIKKTCYRWRAFINIFVET